MIQNCIHIGLYEGSVEVTENKVINYEEIAQKIKLQDEKIYKYLNDLFLEDNHAKELLDNYNYESIPSEELISLVVKKFPIDFEGVHFNNYFFIKYLSKPLPIEQANFSLNLLPAPLKVEIKKFNGEMSSVLDDYILEKYQNKFKLLGHEERLKIALELNFKMFLLEHQG